MGYLSICLSIISARVGIFSGKAKLTDLFGLVLTMSAGKGGGRGGKPGTGKKVYEYDTKKNS